MSFDNGKDLNITLSIEGALLTLTGKESDKLAEDLINACATGQLDQLKELIPQYQGKPPITMPTPEYLLQTAARNGQAEAIRLISDSIPEIFQPPKYHLWDPKLPAGVFPSQIPKKWRTYEDGVVISALEGSDALAVFKLFFEYGMKPDYNLDRAGNTTSFAISSGKIDVDKFFLEKGAKPNGRYLQPEDTYLGTAARQQTSDMLKLLIEKGSKLEGSQALRQAAQCGRLNNAKFLLDLGVDVNELYIRYNVFENKYEISGSALHWAIRGTVLNRPGKPSSKAETVRFLLSHGAKPELVDAAGKSAFQLALDLHEDDVVQVFKEYSINK